MATQKATLDQFTFNYLTKSQVARVATQLNAYATDVATERVTFDCGETEEPHASMAYVACQHLDSHRAGRVITALRAADWGSRRRDYSLTFGTVWYERRLMIAGLGWAFDGTDDERAEFTLIASPGLLIKLFGPNELPANWETSLDVGKHRITVMGLRYLDFDLATGKHSHLLGDSEAYLLRLDQFPQDPCRSTVQLHVKEKPTITATEEDGRKRWALVADEAVVIDPSCGFRFGCAPKT